LIEKKLVYEKDSKIVNFKQNLFAVVILSQMMKRAHLLKTSNDIVFVDPEKHTITFVLAPCATGAVPLGIIITQGNITLYLIQT